MPVNPNWTVSDVALTLSLEEYQNPDGKLVFTTSTVKYYDNETSFTGAFTTGEVQDFILVDMKAGAEYDFLASGDYQVTLSLFDSTGHLLLFSDGDDIGIPDRYPQDSILNFKPDSTGTYKLYITYSNLTTRGNYFIVGSEDLGSNGVNDHLGGGTGGGGLDNSNPILTAVRKAMYNVGREDAYSGSGAAFYTDLGTRLVTGKVGVNAAYAEIVNRADNTASVATLSYEFFTGKAPTGAGFDYLLLSTGINPNNLYSAYYQNFNLENRYINFAVNLGKVGEGKTKFTADYGSLSLFDATKKAYTTIFGGTPTDAKIHALIDTRADYFASYGGDGANGIGTKAAMVGWLLAEAEKADVGMYAKANFAFLTDLALGLANYGVDLIGVYGKAEYAYSG